MRSSIVISVNCLFPVVKVMSQFIENAFYSQHNMADYVFFFSACHIVRLYIDSIINIVYPFIVNCFNISIFARLSK